VGEDARVNPLLRILGIAVLARLAARLPERTARWASAAVLVLANLIPVYGVLQGWLAMGDVFIIYWLENVVVWATSIVKIATAQPDAKGLHPVAAALFFTVHYGIFTVVHGVFTFVFAGMAGTIATWADRLWVLAFIAASHLWSLLWNWFARGERHWVTVQQAMAAPYPRMVVLHVSIIGTGFLLVGRGLGEGNVEASAQVWPVVLLCGLKTALDLTLHLRSHRKIDDVRTDDGSVYTRA